MSRLPEWEKQERLNFASEILQCVEMEGMLPPKVDREVLIKNKLDPWESLNYFFWEPEK